jgi:hypothetical protein
MEIFLLIPCLWLGDGQNSAAASQNRANTEQQPAQSEPSLIPKQNAGQAGYERQGNQSYASKWSEPIVLLTILLFGGVSIQAVIYVWQAVLMRKTLRYSQAAYVVVKEGRLTLFDVGQPTAASITFVNGGNTPAYSLRLYCFMELLGAPPSVDDINVQRYRQRQPDSRHVVAPNGTSDMLPEMRTKLTAEERKSIDDGQLRYYVWGIAIYEDVFKRERWTKFCYAQLKNSTRLNGCADGNEADR